MTMCHLCPQNICRIKISGRRYENVEMFKYLVFFLINTYEAETGIKAKLVAGNNVATDPSVRSV